MNNSHKKTSAWQVKCSILAAFFLAMTHSAPADNSAPLTSSMTFSGRWDLRAPGRAITINTGSYVCVHLTGDSLRARFDLSANDTERPTIAWRIDNGAWQEDEIWPVVQLAAGLPAGPHIAWLMVRGLDEHGNRWTQPLVSSVTFLGFDLGGGGTFLPPLDEWIHPKLKMEFLGDSITEGVLVQVFLDKKAWPWQTDALGSYSCLTAMNLGAMWRQVGFGATGLAHGGSGGAPGALDTFNFFYQGCPRDDWQPDLVVINQGTNDGSMKQADYEPLYAKYLALVRQGYPQAKIVALEPFCGAQGPAILQAVTAAQLAGDKQVYYIDTTGWYSGDLHPNIKSAPALADKLTAALKTVLGW
jgi:lysophospholipase L1-like esterase